jgi:hypothetical protein
MASIESSYWSGWSALKRHARVRTRIYGLGSGTAHMLKNWAVVLGGKGFRVEGYARKTKSREGESVFDLIRATTIKRSFCLSKAQKFQFQPVRLGFLYLGVYCLIHKIKETGVKDRDPVSRSWSLHFFFALSKVHSSHRQQSNRHQ